MSVEEDTELKDLITQTLESNGCFAKIRAQLRASIYLALDENESVQKKEPMLNNKVKSALATQDGRIMFQIVRDFLEFYNLDYTLSVYESESSFYPEKSKNFLDDLNISNSSSPILLNLVKLAKSQTVDASKETIEDHSLKNATYELNKNETFEVNSPMFAKEKEVIVEKSISEDMSEVNASEKSLEFELSEKSSELEVSPPIVRDSKHSKFDSGNEKPKLALHKSLTPNSSKTRSNDMLLPPLYSKELKDMSSQRELEKMFDLEDNYEEDFMSESEVDLGKIRSTFEKSSVSSDTSDKGITNGENIKKSNSVKGDSENI